MWSYARAYPIIGFTAAGCKARFLRCPTERVLDVVLPRLRALSARRLGLVLFAQPRNKPIMGYALVSWPRLKRGAPEAMENLGIFSGPYYGKIF
jgi:hypothetical protein